MKKDIKKLQNGVATLEWQPSGELVIKWKCAFITMMKE